jgi:TolA-binding protein
MTMTIGRAGGRAAAFGMLIAALLGGAARGAEVDARAAFDAAMQAVAQSATPVPEQQVLDMLEASRKFGRPLAANLAVKAWLQRQPSPAPALLLAAAEHASLAGDLKSAASRYKAFIASGPADEARSRGAARLYEILINDLANADDAFGFMSRSHAGLRQSPEARKFDSWLFDQAMARQDFGTAAATVLAVLSNKLPLEAERLIWWDRIDFFMANLARAQAPHFPALTAAKQIPGLLRECPPRAARYAFIAAWLEYRAGAAGKDPAALAQSFAPVAAAATAYADAAPTAAALADMQWVFFCGTNNHGNWPPAQTFQDCWTAAFAKLPDAEKASAINYAGWWNYQATPQQLIELGAKFPNVFRAAAATATLPPLTNAPDPAVYAKQATFLAGVTSDAAKIANALAATNGTDLAAGFRHLTAAESWHGNFDSTFRIARDNVWPIWRAFPRQPAATDADWYKAIVAWGPDGITRSPLAIFDPPAAAMYLLAVFQAGGTEPADKSHVAAALRSLDWVPWDAAVRQAVVKPTHDAFTAWAGQVRQELDAADKVEAKKAEKPKWEKAAAQIGPLEEEFKKAFDPNVSATADLAKAADPLAGNLARCVQAVRAKNLEAYLAGARAAYPLLRDYMEKKTPFGGPAFIWLLTNHEGLDLTPFHCEVIADQLQAWAPGKATAVMTAIDTALGSGRPGGVWHNVPPDRAPRALAINAVIGKGLLALLDKGQFDINIFHRLRHSRMGPGWRDENAGKDVVAKVIDTKAFLVHKQRLGVHGSATADSQWLIRNEYPALAPTYPPETYFDDMFVEEFKGQGWLDAAFFAYSRDEKRKAATLAAEKFAACTALATGPGNPLGFDQLPLVLQAGDRRDIASRSTPFWTRADFDRWQAHAYAAPAPLPGKMLETANAAWGKTRFDGDAMGYPAVSRDPAVMQNPEARKALFTQLAQLTDRRARDYPERSQCPYLGAIHQIPFGSFSAEELDVLVAVVEKSPPVSWPGGNHFEHLGIVVAERVATPENQLRFAALARELWRIGRDTGNAQYLGMLAAKVAALGRAGAVDVAGGIASAGIDMLGTGLPEAIRNQLTVVRSEALLAAGGTNPVPRSDARWPIYESQIAFGAGKLQSAWDLYLPAAAVAAQMHRDLDPAYVIWLIRENTANGNYERARELGQLMVTLTDTAPGALDAESQAAALVAFADIALTSRQYPQARALYERIVAAKEFDGTLGKRDAELRVAEVDRLSRQYDRAKEQLEKLSRRPDKTLQAEAFYQLAQLAYDQEEYKEAGGFLEQVFARFPDHVGGRLLEGKVSLATKRIEKATRVKLGVLGNKKYLVPGKPLEVDLEDKNLAVVGKATQIEVRAWTGSGDEERFILVPFGDAKTQFSGALPTQLGAATKGDRVLQVLGGDTVHYDFAESFRARRGTSEPPPALTVVTDGDLFVSSGAILSKEEQEARALEQAIRARLQVTAADGEKQQLLSTVRQGDQVKPGNPINVRVIDLDRGTTAEIDRLQVRVNTSSGDSLVTTLTETQPVSGIFEGAVTTGASQPIAYASDSAEGSDPNNAIGPGDNPPWVAASDAARPKIFSIDLNDNVALGTMTVTAAMPGRKFKDVYVQTSLNGRDFVTRGQWRADGQATFSPWNGAPRMDLVRLGVPGRPPVKLDTPADFEDLFDRGRHATGAPLVAEALATPAIGPFDHALGGRLPRMQVLDGTYVGHWRAAFEIAKPQTRTFTLDPKGRMDRIRYLFLVDGKGSDQADKPLAITRALTRGVHRIDVYATAHVHSGLHFDVLLDAAEPPFTEAIPPEFFNPEKHPAIADAYAVQPAAFQVDGDRLKIDFGKGTRARVVRLMIADFETDAPAINAITLTDATGRRVLPTEKNFAELSRNDVLEIIPGDRITIGYDDPTEITPQRKAQERFLTVTFSDATLSAAFAEFSEAAGERQVAYVPLRRFKPGDAVQLFVNDPDMDTGAGRDRVTLAVKAGSGPAAQVEAIETGDHTGIFVGAVFPVEGKPQRASEVAVDQDADLVVSYFDADNTSPGIGWERTVTVEQVGSDPPLLFAYDVASRPLDEQEIARVPPPQPEAVRKSEEQVPVSREIVVVRPNDTERETPAQALVDGPIVVEVIHPAITQTPRSTADLFVQTEAGRQRLGRTIEDGEFPLDAPGTIRLGAGPSNLGGLPLPPGASRLVVTGNRFASDPLTDGRYTFLVPKALGPLPERSLVDDKPDQVTGGPVLQIRGDDAIHVGYRFADAESGEERWITRRFDLSADPLFHVMDQRYKNTIAGTHVGESLHVRLINPALDTTDDKDVSSARVRTSGGVEMDLPLMETLAHSGVFKGSFKLSYREPPPADGPAAGGTAAAPTDSAPAAGASQSLPVTYGETVTLVYELAGRKPLVREVLIFKGDDAKLVPFTKQFKDPEIAVQTQFTVAESWFELAKRHRELGQESLARREIAQGKKLLEEAIADYPNTQARAQADYLLGNLAFEFSREAANEQLAMQSAMEALTRFSDIVASYPESEYAPKSQFKKALVLEKLGQIDQACEEYVKLSYTYPENELVAETIARLGQYFLSKGKALDKQAETEADPVEKEKIGVQVRTMFTTAAQVFSRLGERFPQHALAMKTRLLAAQCYLRAKDLDRAVNLFEVVYKDPRTDKDLAAEAMYWAGDVYMQKQDPKNAYKALKKLTFDYPESKWAKFARGRLSEDGSLVGVESALQREGR